MARTDHIRNHRSNAQHYGDGQQPTPGQGTARTNPREASAKIADGQKQVRARETAARREPLPVGKDAGLGGVLMGHDRVVQDIKG